MSGEQNFCAECGGRREVTADCSVIGPWETFEMTQMPGANRASKRWHDTVGLVIFFEASSRGDPFSRIQGSLLGRSLINQKGGGDHLPLIDGIGGSVAGTGARDRAAAVEDLVLSPSTGLPDRYEKAARRRSPACLSSCVALPAERMAKSCGSAARLAQFGVA